MNWEAADVDVARVAAVVDPHFERSLQAQSAPGIAYAVLSGGSVVHSRGIGALALPDGPTPGASTVFRIASMTKSFTALALVGLRDDGLLGPMGLDVPVVDVVPELAAGGRSARQITVRHLLTMGGGFLTDDPWGDRQQDLPISDFRRLVGQGLTPLWPPGTRFEYSNLGYALLGLVIEGITGEAYRDVVGSRVLEPLGLTSTGFTPHDLGDVAVAQGYVRRTSGWVAEPLAASGAFSPMGGVLSTVNDLAIWVGMFQSALAGDGQLLPGLRPGVRSASLREMQVTQRVVSATSPGTVDGPPDVTGYGFGLFEDFRAWGRSVHHSGGYPGFGSHMRWHPASGLGIVALANGTYAPMSTVATAALSDLVAQLDVPLRSTPGPLPMLEAAEAAVTSWLSGDDPEGDSAATIRALCADNVEIDVPWVERVAVWHAFRRSHGAVVTVPDTAVRASPGSVSWEMRGTDPKNRLRVTVLMAPHDTRLVQSIGIKAIAPTEPGPRAATDWT